MYMSFADEYDALTGQAQVMAQKRVEKIELTQPIKNTLKQQFTRESRRHNGASEDSGMGGFILDSLFEGAFPGLGAVLQAASLGTGNAVELYDQTRQAFFGKDGKKITLNRRPLTDRRMAITTPPHPGALPVYAKARKKVLMMPSLG